MCLYLDSTQIEELQCWRSWRTFKSGYMYGISHVVHCLRFRKGHTFSCNRGRSAGSVVEVCHIQTSQTLCVPRSVLGIVDVAKHPSSMVAGTICLHLKTDNRCSLHSTDLLVLYYRLQNGNLGAAPPFRSQSDSNSILNVTFKEETFKLRQPQHRMDPDWDNGFQTTDQDGYPNMCPPRKLQPVSHQISRHQSDLALVTCPLHPS